MKTIFKYILSVALGASILTSCDLDTIPTTSVDAGSVFGKTGDAEKVLTLTQDMEQCCVPMTQWDRTWY